MKNFNQVLISGNLVRDFELSFSKTGKEIGKFTIARKEHEQADSCFYNCVVFGESAQRLAKLSKGMGVLVIGSLSQSSYLGKDGMKRQSFSIVCDEVIFTPKQRGQEKKSKLEGVSVKMPITEEGIPF